MPSPRYLAIDAGGTSSRAVVIAADGTCLGRGRGGGGNPTSNGATAALAAIGTCSAAALAEAGADGREVAGVVVAAAGLGLDGPDGDGLARTLGRLGVHAPLFQTSDAVAAFHSGADQASGHVLIAGTGAAAQRVEDEAIVATADGLGWLIGDVGSGAWLGRRVVTAVADELDGRGTPTGLTPAVLGELGITSAARESRDEYRRPVALAQVLTAVYAEPAVRLARFAPLAFELPGDAVCDALLADAADGLARTLEAVMPSSRPATVVGTGGMLAHQPRLQELVVAAMAGRGRSITLRIVPDGLAGAALLALRHAGVTLTQELRDHVRASLYGATA